MRKFHDNIFIREGFLSIFSRIFLFFCLLIYLTSCSVFQESRELRSRRPANENPTSCLESLHTLHALQTLLAPASFLRKADNTLHQSRNVTRTARALPELKKPEHQIAFWLIKLEERLKNSDQVVRSKDLESLRRFYQRNHVIKNKDVPESYFEAQRRIMREQGHGDVSFTLYMREERIAEMKANQRQSLDKWMNYLLSSDADQYPVWVRYWSFEGMLKLGVFNDETGKFSKRTASTITAFAELNQEAYANVVDVLVRRINGESLEDLTDEAFKNLVESGASFGALYGRQLKLLKESSGADLLRETSGVWIKYDKGSSADELVDSLNGKNTGWCTAGHSTATSQLKDGDFFVYYTKDKNGKMSSPRIAIRMRGSRIAEVRGVGANQNIDEVMAGTDILDQKLLDFGVEGERYKKRSSDMRRLTEIEKKHKKAEELTKDELRFLYELDSEIEGFGYEKDPRVVEITLERNVKQDISLITGFKASEISLTKDEALKGGIKYHFGDLSLNSLTSAEDIIFPERIGGGLYLHSLNSVNGLKLPKQVGKDIHLNSLTSADGLILPESVGGNLHLSSLTWSAGIKLPKKVGGKIDLSSLMSAQGLELPESIGNLDLRSLVSAKGLKLPESIDGEVILISLTSAEDLQFPKHVGGGLYLRALKSAEGLTLPENIGGSLDLKSLTSAVGLNLPKHVNGNIYLNSLNSLDGLVIPAEIDRSSIVSKFSF